MITQIRHQSKPVRKTPSTSQLKRRNSFRVCCRFWRKSLTKSQKASWISCTLKGQTAYNTFLRINVVRVFNDLQPLVSPPGDY